MSYKEGGYKRLMERYLALFRTVNQRVVSVLWEIKKENLKQSYTLDATYHQAIVAQLTGHEIRLHAQDGALVCQLVKNPAAVS